MSKTKLARAAASVTTMATDLPAGYVDVRSGIAEVLSVVRRAAARNVNALMTASYWEIGRRIVEAGQKGKRCAGYGEQLITRLSVDLTLQFGRGFSSQNLWQMRQLFLAWGVNQILQTLSVESKKTQSLPTDITHIERTDDVGAMQPLSAAQSSRLLS